MRLRYQVALFTTVIALAAGTARAEQAATPQALIPRQTDLLFEVPEPLALVEAVLQSASYAQLARLSVVKEALAGTKIRQGRQLLAYLEKQLGVPWPELLDRLAGGGAALALKFEAGPPSALLVVQGKDEKLLKRFADVVLDVAGQELARQDAKDHITRGSYLDLPTVQIGADVFAAVAGSALVLSNNKEVLQRALDLHRGKSRDRLAAAADVASAAKRLLPGPLAKLWINLEPAHKSPAGKAIFKTPRDTPLTAVLGGPLDIIGRSPWVVAGLYRASFGVDLGICLPCGRDGMGPERDLFTPPPAQPGSRPLLAPQSALYSDSGYYDVARIWQDRGQLFGAPAAKALEKFDKDYGRFLSRVQLNKLLMQAGTYYRLVVVNQRHTSYATRPLQTVPAFAVVLELREPESFSKSMNIALRGAALLALTRVKLQMVEEKHAGCDLVGWRFDESAKVRADVNNARFGYSPCFATVGNQFVVSSTLELGRELIDLLKKETPGAGTLPIHRVCVFSAGVAELMQGLETQLFTQAVLDQALAPGEAKTQVRDLIDLVRRVGTLSLETNLTAKELRYDLRLTGQPLP